MICFLSGYRGVRMSLIGELSRIIGDRRYNELTFSVNGIPIITVEYRKDKEVLILINNMEKLRVYSYKFEGDVDKFVKDVENAFVYSGIDEIIKKLRGVSIKFYAEPYLDGEVMPNKVIVNKGDVSIDEEGQEFVYSNRYEITGVIELKSYTLAEIITAFAVPHYL